MAEENEEGMSTLKEGVQSVIKTTVDRTSGVYTGPFILSWIAVNWRLLLMLAFGADSIQEKITIVEESTFDIFCWNVHWLSIWSLFVMPAVIGLCLLVFFRLSNLFVKGAILRIDDRLNPWTSKIQKLEATVKKTDQLMNVIAKTKATFYGASLSSGQKRKLSPSELAEVKSTLPKIDDSDVKKLNKTSKVSSDLKRKFTEFKNHSPLYAEFSDNHERLWEWILAELSIFFVQGSMEGLLDINSINFNHETYSFFTLSKKGRQFSRLLLYPDLV